MPVCFQMGVNQEQLRQVILHELPSGAGLHLLRFSAQVRLQVSAPCIVFSYIL